MTQVTPQPGAAEQSGAAAALRRFWRPALLVLGAIALTLVVRSVGLDNIVATLLQAAAWMPFIVATDLLFFGCETQAYRVVLGPGVRDIPMRRFITTQLLCYSVMVLAPLGRAGAELARGTAFAPYVGAGRVTAAGTNMQAGVLIANFFASLPAWIAVSSVVGADHPLAWLLALNGVGTGVAGLVMLLTLRRSRIGRWLGEKLPRFALLGADLDAALAASPRALAQSIAWCSAARLAQLGQYAILLGAVGGSVSLASALTAMGVHLVGAGFGDLIPNQVGVLEGAYGIFAGALGLADEPARAVSIALLARISQITIASVGMVVLAVVRVPSPPTASSSSASTPSASTPSAKEAP